MVAIHVLFFVSLVLERRFLAAGWARWWPFWLAVLALAEALRAWVLVSLGPYWTTRILVVADAKPVTAGPYRFIRHPNYVAVAAEVFAIPMLCGAWVTAAVFSVANAVVLAVRIREEERARSRLAGD
jgi:methyltransferase